MELKKLLRVFLRFLCHLLPVRGRHRLADKLGRLIAPNYIEYIKIGDILFPIDHSIRMYRFIYYGIYEEEFINFLRRVITKGDVVIDPGTNVGYISAFVSGLVGKEGRIFSVEPSKICFDKLQKYLVSPNIRLYFAAISDVKGRSLFIDKATVVEKGYSTLAEFTSKADNDSAYEVETITIDDLVTENQLKKIKLLKLDVEGAELKALYGSIESIKNKQIDYILIETGFSNTKKAYNNEIYTLLTSSNYKPYRMLRNSLVALDFFNSNNKRQDVIWTHLDIKN